MSEEIIFAARQDFRRWLTHNARTSKGIWLILGKNSRLKTIKASEALEEALCFGWIDGQIKSIDETTYLKYFSPRRKNSPWSVKNKKLAEDLCQKGLMTESGLKAIKQAKETGRWDPVAAKPDYAALIKQFQLVLKDDKVAHDHFAKAPASYQKQIVGFYFDAKQEETRSVSDLIYAKS